MPLNQAELGSSIENLIISAISSKYPDSKKQPSMTVFSTAVATGVVGYYTGATGKIQTSGFLGGSVVGLQGLNPASMASTIETFCKASFKSKGGIALPMMCKGIADSVCQEFDKATIVGTDGGRADKFQNGSYLLMADTMFKSTGWPDTGYNRIFFEAISQAIYSEILDKGFVIIPPSSPGSGGGKATIS